MDPLAPRVARRHRADIDDTDAKDRLREIGAGVQEAITEVEDAVIDLEEILVAAQDRLTPGVPVEVRRQVAREVEGGVQRVQQAHAVLLARLRQAQSDLDNIAARASYRR